MPMEDIMSHLIMEMAFIYMMLIKKNILISFQELVLILLVIIIQLM